MRHALRILLCALAAFALPAAVSFGQSQSETPAQDKQDSVADAARKAKEKKAASAKGKVFTEEDLSGMKQDGVSVVGSETTKRSSRVSAPEAKDADQPNGEEYWRGKAQPILEEMAKIDQRIAQLKEDIKKYGIGGVDVATGMKDGVAYVHDRNGQIEKLQKKKASLQKELEDLEEQGRKAGAQPAWFR